MSTETEVVERQSLDKLLHESKLYHKSKDFKELLDFVAKLRHFAPFNAMLLQVQKMGLTYAASERDWLERFGRKVKDGARPLLIMWPFGPVALVYDLQDTEGPELPRDATTFFARGPVTREEMLDHYDKVRRNRIDVVEADEGDGSAGRIKVLFRSQEVCRYRLVLNKNHSPALQFATLIHELGHLFLGHLGPDKKLRIAERPVRSEAQRELEAESVSYLVCKRQGIETNSEAYLNKYVGSHTTLESLDVYRVMWASGHVESLLGIAEKSCF